MIQDRADDLFSAAAVEALRRHPLLRAACEADADAANALYLALPVEARWFARDIGRYGLCLGAMLLELMGMLSLQTLIMVAGNDVASAGRARRLVQRAESIGWISIEPGDAPRSQRPMRLGAPWTQLVLNRSRSLVVLSLSIASNPADIAAVLADEGLLRQFMLRAAQVSTERRDLFAFRSERPIDLFASREAGMFILQDLLLRQAPERERLFEAAPLSRYRLARTYGVSRAHINRLLADSPSVKAGEDTVVFHAALSRDYERYFVTNVLLVSAAAREVVGGWRYPPAIG